MLKNTFHTKDDRAPKSRGARSECYICYCC